MRTEGERLARQLDNDAKVAGDRLETLTASLDTVKQLASQTNEQDVQLRALEREAKTERDLLESYLAKYREATARDNINAAPPEARIISRASPAIKPDYPKKLPTVLIAAFAAFALSAGFIGDRRAAVAGVGTGVLRLAYAPAGLPRRLTQPGDRAAAGAPSGHAARTVAAIDAVRSARSRHGGRAGDSQHGGADRAEPCARPARPAAASPWSAPRAMSAPPLPRFRSPARWRSSANVVLVDLAFGAPNLSIISTDPKAPGIAELVRGTASFGDIITRDQFSPVHLVATGHVGNDAAGARRLADAGDRGRGAGAQLRSRRHRCRFAASDIAVERFAPLAARAVLVADDPANPATRAARERLMMAGFADVTLLAGAPQVIAALDPGAARCGRAWSQAVAQTFINTGLA